MKPSTALAVVLIVLLGAGAAVMSGLFSGSKDSNSSGPTTAGKKDPKDPGSTPEVEAPQVGETGKAEPDGTVREPVRTVAKSQDENAMGNSTIAGRVVNKSNQGIPNANVTLYFGPANPVMRTIMSHKPTGFSAKTDADGNYVLEDIAAGTNYVITASHPDYAQGERLISALGKGESVVPEIVLTPGSTLKGMVNSLVTQTPLAGATVELWDILNTNYLDASQKKPWASVTTDANGNYEIKTVHFTSFELVCSAAGHATQVKREQQIFLQAPAEGNRIFNFDMPAAHSIRGVVTDARGTPIADVRIEGDQINQAPNAPSSRSNVQSKGDGTFELASLGEGTYQLTAQKKGFSQKLVGQFPADANDVRVQLESRGIVRGKTHDATGRAATRFQLMLKAVREDKAWPTNQTQSFNSANGSFEFVDVEPGQYEMEATVDGFAPSSSAKFFVDRDHPTENIEIILRQGGGLSGRVMSSKGEPVAGAEVNVEENGYQDNFLSKIFAEMPGSAAPRIQKARTRKDGSFLIEHLDATSSPIQISVKAMGFTAVTKPEVALTEGQVTDIGIVTLSSGGEIHGRCVDQSGKPFFDGSITASLVPDPNNPASQTAALGSQQTRKPDYDGRFILTNLPPGEWKLSLMAEQVDGQPVNPLLAAMLASKTEKTVVVRDGVATDVTLTVPPAQQQK